MEEWKEYRLGDVCIMKNGRKRPIEEGEYPVYGGNGIMGYSNQYNAEDTIIVGRVGAYCGNVLLSKNKCWVSDNAISVVAKNQVHTDFLYYLMLTLDLHNQHIGAVQPLMTQDIIGRFEVKIPSLSTQLHIADILKSLNDKIEVNRKINSNLEEQKALFKSWFIDFEPFKGGKFVDSELGKIPEGWKMGRYDDIVEGTIAGDWGKEKSVGNYLHEVTCIRGCDFQDIKNGLRGNAPTRFILEKNFKNKRFASHDILVEISGGTQTVSTGRVCPISQKLLDRYNSNVVCTNFCRVVRPTEGYSAFVYYSWLYKYDHKVMFGYENGTSGIKNFRLNDFLSTEPLIIPPKNKVVEFQNIIDVINSQMQTRGAESSKLANVRDTLLPKLMSGEIDVR